MTDDEYLIPKPAPPHRFGEFIIPDHCHIKGFGGISADKAYAADGPYGKGNKDLAKPRLEND